MNTICDKRCIIGEGPIWNEKEQKLYFTNEMKYVNLIFIRAN